MFSPHPFDEGVYFVETHWPTVKIFRKEKRIEVSISISRPLRISLESSSENFTPHLLDRDFNSENTLYRFEFSSDDPQGSEMIERIRDLNKLLSFCAISGAHEDYIAQTRDVKESQLVFVEANNPPPGDWRPQACGLWAHFHLGGTEYFRQAHAEPLSEFVSSRMRGAHKIFHPNMKHITHDVWMHLRHYGNIVPDMHTTGSCACFGVEGNRIDHNGGFTLSPHNVDVHFQQFILMIGTLTMWQKMRADIQRQL